MKQKRISVEEAYDEMLLAKINEVKGTHVTACAESMKSLASLMEARNELKEIKRNTIANAVLAGLQGISIAAETTVHVRDMNHRDALEVNYNTPSKIDNKRSFNLTKFLKNKV